MSAKQLDTHSLPLVLLAVAVVAFSLTRVVALAGSPAVEAATRPVVKITRSSAGTATLEPNLSDEAVVPAGVINELPADPTAMFQIGQAGRTLTLQMAVEAAVAGR